MGILSRMASDVSVSKITHCDPCLFEKISTEATGFCVDCVEALCSQCRTFHGKNKASRSHAVLTANPDQSRAIFFAFFKDALLCKFHPESSLTHYCDIRKQYVCPLCPVAHASQHCQQIVETNQASDKFKQRNVLLKENKNQIATLKKKIDKSDKKLKANSKLIENKRTVLVQQLHKHIDALDKRLEAETEMLVKAELEKEPCNLNDCKETELMFEAIVSLVPSIKTGTPSGKHQLLASQLESRLISIKRRVSEHVIRPDNQIELFESKNDIVSLGTVTTERQSSDVVVSSIAGNDAISEDNIVAKMVENRTQRRNEVCEPQERAKMVDEKILKPIKTENNPTQSQKTSCESQEHTQLIDKNLETSKPEDNQTQNMRCSLPKELNKLNTRECSLESRFHLSKCRDKSADVTSMCVLKNGWIVIADGENKMLEGMDETGQSMARVSVSYVAQAMCELGDFRVAVIFSKCTDIFMFVVTRESIRKERQVACEHKSISITRFRCDMALLVDTGNGYKIEVHSSQDGRILLSIDSFYSRNHSELLLKNPTCLLYVGNGKFVVGDGRKAHCFDKYGNEIWFYRQHTYSNKTDTITSLALDGEGNVYICCRKPENIHQVSSKNYNVNKVLLKNLEYVSAVAFDMYREKLYVGFGTGDKISCYVFL